jgi:hypothetical protein
MLLCRAEADNYTPEAYDKYLTAEVNLANMGTLVQKAGDSEATQEGCRRKSSWAAP